MSAKIKEKYNRLVNNLEKDKKMLLGVFILGLFVFVFFACMLAFIARAEVCFLNPPVNTGTASPVPGVMSKEDKDFTIAGNIIASLGLIAGIIVLILCAIVLNNIRKT